MGGYIAVSANALSNQHGIHLTSMRLKEFEIVRSVGKGSSKVEVFCTSHNFCTSSLGSQRVVELYAVRLKLFRDLDWRRKLAANLFSDKKIIDNVEKRGNHYLTLNFLSVRKWMDSGEPLSEET